MDVKYIVTTSNKLSELSIVNGQLIYLSDLNASYYDMGGTRRHVCSMRLVSSLPSTSTAQDGLIYGITNASGYVDAYVWDAGASTYRSLSGYVATTSSLGLVKPDGVTIQIDANGVISTHSEVISLPATSVTYDNSTSQLAATNAQLAIDEVNVIASGAATAASSAVSDASNALNAAMAATSLANDAQTLAYAATSAAASATSIANGKQDQLTVGSGISIDDNNVISSREYYGTCTGQSTNQNKAVSVSSDQGFALQQGAVIHVKFDADNTYSASSTSVISLNVNSTGNKPVYYGNSGATTGTNTVAFGRANYYNEYFYDGTYWVWQGTSRDNDTTNIRTLGFGYGTCHTAGATTAKTVDITNYNLIVGGLVSIKFTNAVPANATLNINSKGAKNIYYHGSAIPANLINAGDTVLLVYSTQYHVLAVDSMIGNALVVE